MNAVEIEKAISELAAQHDRAEFPFAFLRLGARQHAEAIAGRDDQRLQFRRRPPAQQHSYRHVRSRHGRQTLKALREAPRRARRKPSSSSPRRIDLQAEDLVNGESVLHLPRFPELFPAFLAGITTVNKFARTATSAPQAQQALCRAAERDPDWATAERPRLSLRGAADLLLLRQSRHHQRRGTVPSTVERLSDHESTNTHEIISNIFRAMDTPTRHEGKLDDRYRKAANIPPHADAFPYVKCAAFRRVEVPRFSRMARSYSSSAD